MKFLSYMIAAVCAAAFTSQSYAVMPPMPPMTNGDGNPANNGMKHAMVSLTGTILSVHVDTPPPNPVTMTSGHGVDYDPPKFDVLEDVYFNAQHGWLPSGFIALPSDRSIWMRRTGTTQPTGSTFKTYDGGNGMEGMGAWTMSEIYAADGATWAWDGVMQHDYFTADVPGSYSMSFEVYVGDSAGDQDVTYTPASATFSFVAVPEPSGFAVAILGIGFLITRRR